MVSITYIHPVIPELLHGIPLALHKHIVAFPNLFTNEMTEQLNKGKKCEVKKR